MFENPVPDIPATDTRRDPGVDAYIDALAAWQQDICRRIRDIAHAADPDVQEVIKRTVQPYFVLQGNVGALLATKDHVNLFIYDGGLSDDPHGVITAGHGNSTARTIGLYRDDPIDDAAIGVILRQIVAVNRAGGWRALKKQQSG